MEREILIADEVAAMLRIVRQRLYQLVRTHQIPVIRVGTRQYRFSAAAIKRWLESGGNENSPAPAEAERSEA